MALKKLCSRTEEFLKENEEMWILLSGCTDNQEESQIKLFASLEKREEKTGDYFPLYDLARILPDPQNLKMIIINAALEVKEHSNYIWKWIAPPFHELSTSFSVREVASWFLFPENFTKHLQNKLNAW